MDRWREKRRLSVTRRRGRGYTTQRWAAQGFTAPPEQPCLRLTCEPDRAPVATVGRLISSFPVATWTSRCAAGRAPAALFERYVSLSVALSRPCLSLWNWSGKVLPVQQNKSSLGLDRTAQASPLLQRSRPYYTRPTHAPMVPCKGRRLHSALGPRTSATTPSASAPPRLSAA
jgi:hypothetical protein